MPAIKRIIFDLDDTLIPWKQEYNLGLTRALNEFQLSYKEEEIDNIVNSYEENYKSYTISNFLEHAKNNNIYLNNEFVETWLEYLGDMGEENPEIIDVLEYLSKKYELVVLTNWFQESQAKRLATARMSSFFKEIHGGDECIKPSKASYLNAIGKNSPEECVMIGDNFEIDIIGAINAGLRAIHLSKKEEHPGITTIRNLKELKNIL